MSPTVGFLFIKFGTLLQNDSRNYIWHGQNNTWGDNDAIMCTIVIAAMLDVLNVAAVYI